MTTGVLQFFEATTKYLEKKDTRVKKKRETENERTLLCRSCKHLITDESDRITVNQSHTHTCKNPSGLIFTFGCFRDAPGCVISGTASYEFTWFAGYAWQIAICANCGIHLGWRFRNSDQFFALIINRLISQ